MARQSHCEEPGTYKEKVIRYKELMVSSRSGVRMAYLVADTGDIHTADVAVNSAHHNAEEARDIIKPLVRFDVEKKEAVQTGKGLITIWFRMAASKIRDSRASKRLEKIHGAQMMIDIWALEQGITPELP